MPFEFLGILIEGIVDFVGDLFSEGGEMLAGAAELAAEVGTSVVAIGAGAMALGAIVALAELTVNTIRNYLNSKQVAKKIEDILNNDEETLKALLPKERLAGANKCSIGEMYKSVHSVRKTSDGQTVATVRIVHPKSGVYLDAPIAGNKATGIYEGLVL